MTLSEAERERLEAERRKQAAGKNHGKAAQSLRRIQRKLLSDYIAEHANSTPGRIAAKAGMSLGVHVGLIVPPKLSGNKREHFRADGRTSARNAQ